MYQWKILSGPGLGALTPYTGTTTTTKTILKTSIPITTTSTSIFKPPLNPIYVPTGTYTKPTTQSPPIYVPRYEIDVPPTQTPSTSPGTQPPTSTTVIVPPPPSPTSPAPTPYTPTPGLPVDTQTGTMPSAGTQVVITPGGPTAEEVYQEYVNAAGQYPNIPWGKVMIGGLFASGVLVGALLARR